MKIYKKYLKEAIDSKSRRKIISIIHNFTKGKTKLDILGNVIEINGNNESIIFTYSNNNVEITKFLVDIVDSIPSRNFSYNDKNGKITFIIKKNEK